MIARKEWTRRPEKKRPRVYISGPISLGDPEHNFTQAAAAQRELIRLGFAPLNPMLSMKLPGHEAISHADWIASDLPWVELSEAVLRLPGKSVGADMETDYAAKHDVPVFHDIDSLNKAFRQDGGLRVIGLHGFPGVGKDEVAKILVDEFGFTRIAFADPVRAGTLGLDPWVHVTRAEADSLLGLDVNQGFYRISELVSKIGWTLAKKIADVRVYLQRYGTEAGREIHGPDCWTVKALRQAGKVLRDGGKVVFTDCRFPNEKTDVVWSLGGMIWRVTRPGVGAVNSHKSELEFSDDDIDMVIENDGTLKQLAEKVAGALTVCGLVEQGWVVGS